ncbi:hypothetical protein A5733_00900 [Mycobacterium sp. NS-7484]|uniref:ESX-1 secretion-associated protein n=1 Tax=Mycobacterium sp. NS-7484 TaxID=1834161 RepID=UPI00096DE418|nr:ESX-1 secretion-associated protein [Mycobacterium sp. NS-7484]OMB99261.1 hypothetical protein A5733_00900 [Mycobacterium sp. NS-7484]
MSEGMLGVTTAHVRALADGQSTVKDYLEQVSQVTDGVSASMMVNHGPVCAVSITALAFANSAREAACAAMASVSEDLSEKLNVAASGYDQTDCQAGGWLDKEMHPR